MWWHPLRGDILMLCTTGVKEVCRCLLCLIFLQSVSSQITAASSFHLVSLFTRPLSFLSVSVLFNLFWILDPEYYHYLRQGRYVFGEPLQSTLKL